MARLIKSFSTDDGGATAIEYGLIAALIAVAIIGSLTSLSGAIGNTFGRASNSLTAS